MYILAGFAVGGTIGALTARRRGGNRADMAQYAVGYGIAFALVTVFALIAIRNML